MAEVATESKTDKSPAANGEAPMNGEQQEAHYQLPDAKALEEAGNLLVRDENGNETPFKSLYENQPGRRLCVFVRHFYCGHCEEYVRYLAKHLPPEKLASASPPITLTIIGCGDPQCIPDYRTRTMSSLSKPYPIYTDRDRAIYTKLGMIQQLGGETKPEYLTTSVTSSVVSSLKNIITSGPKGFKGGNYSQNGGEWLFEDGELKWVRRMRNSADHALIEELRDALGMQ
ncbi:uncharacterized protein LTR77_005049 [Saxophila tyrrhenica]|uniref:Thioredoxin-like protein n=1 Tax=Saxophila tyrrhenica TaxID=1690608 RepID=A0AAV9PBS6_9PEZI|nr:hypothetical protein LTR77_005049 [Saxophila tyrrhenica]